VAATSRLVRVLAGRPSGRSAANAAPRSASPSTQASGSILTVGSFDDPAPFFPTDNYGIESKHAAWEDTSHLPGHKVTETASVIQRWADAGLEVPE
jgi:hypothetical protein